MPSSIPRLPLLLCLALVAACKAPPVWRSPDFGPDQPTPTLAAAAVYTYYVPSQSVDLTGVDLRDLGKAIGNYVKDNPDEVARGVGNAMSAMERIEFAVQTVAAVAPSLQQQMQDYLRGQGFELEFDESRAVNITNDGMVASKYSYIVPGTVGRPFGQYPLFGPGSKGSIAERLKGGREREAYASMRTTFATDGNDISRGVNCSIVVQVLDQAGNEVFGATVGGSSGAGDPPQVLRQAFADAMAKMQQPESYQ